jgi:hypothetical protein
MWSGLPLTDCVFCKRSFTFETGTVRSLHILYWPCKKCISRTKQQAVLTHRYRIWQEKEKSWHILTGPILHACYDSASFFFFWDAAFWRIVWVTETGANCAVENEKKNRKKETFQHSIPIMPLGCLDFFSTDLPESLFSYSFCFQERAVNGITR